MRQYVFLVCLALFAAACGGADPEGQLRDSFFQQVGSTSGVRDLQRNDAEVAFTTQYQGNPNAKWRVTIDSSSVDFAADKKTPQKGTVKSTWSVDGQTIRPRGDQSDLPLAFLENGLAQDCWASWDEEAGNWSWK